MHENDYRMFDGFYIPVIPDADYHFDTDHRGCNFLFIDDRQRRYVISFESCLDVYEKCVNFPQYKKSEYRENGRTMHTLLLEREEDDERKLRLLYSGYAIRQAGRTGICSEDWRMEGNGFTATDFSHERTRRRRKIECLKIINNNRYDREEQSNE